MTLYPTVTTLKPSRDHSYAQSHFWWTRLDKNIEILGKSCTECQQNQPNPPPMALHPWIWPDIPWKRVHVDFARPFLGHMFIVAVDTFSKWPEAEMITLTMTEKTLEVLRSMFARYGLPDQLVSNNGPRLTSNEFKSFLKATEMC